jgi:hypothetical protein
LETALLLGSEDGYDTRTVWNVPVKMKVRCWMLELGDEGADVDRENDRGYRPSRNEAGTNFYVASDGQAHQPH